MIKYIYLLSNCYSILFTNSTGRIVVHKD